MTANNLAKIFLNCVFFIGPGYRVYYTIKGRLIVVLLVGGDKSTQAADIKQAKKLAQKFGD